MIWKALHYTSLNITSNSTLSFHFVIKPSTEW
jgi:hypothetical protein